MGGATPGAAFHPNMGPNGWTGIFIHISRVKLWNPSKVSNSDEAQYSCEPLEDLQLLFRKAPQDK
jgi:hypothetical protein